MVRLPSFYQSKVKFEDLFTQQDCLTFRRKAVSSYVCVSRSLLQSKRGRDYLINGLIHCNGEAQWGYQRFKETRDLTKTSLLWWYDQ